MSQLELLRMVYVSPSLIEKLSYQNWNQLIKEAYATGMLARLYYLFEKSKVNSFIPEKLLWHFKSACRYAQAHKKDMMIEVEHVSRTFKMSGQVPVYLKGVAYLLAEDDASNGRVFSDIDVYTNINSLPNVERFLQWQGWSAGNVDAYDELYYREWMHEIPALTHNTRGSTLDVHHNLLPRTSRLTFDALLIEKNVCSDTNVLAPEDRVIHSIVHLFLESEFDKGMRDMTDIDLLLRQHQKQNNLFTEKIVERAFELGVELMVFYAFRYLSIYLKTDIHPSVSNKLSKHSPNRVKLKLMDKLFGQVLFAPLNTNDLILNKVAHLLMYIRGHYLRMPLHLLLPHLAHKAFLAPYVKWQKNRKYTDV
ncbi:nucleotidyltransferase domain-containing protein [Thalassotalea atypica]|uniref:nucleotidyltransferase domain-containing protein n=1 Tax=Thalassotalea atypica TaxID=2054316 RepID=UPI0025736209|nr:nucleotidyltransferase family protein [Thalassotalea atypica]